MKRLGRLRAVLAAFALLFVLAPVARAVDFSNDFETLILEYVTKRTAPATPPTALEVRLHSGDPGEDCTANTFTEQDGYLHQSIATDTSAASNVQFNALDTDGTATRVTNKVTITFGPATADWPAATYFSVWDTDNSICILHAALSATLQVNNTQSAEFQDGDLRLKAD